MENQDFRIRFNFVWVLVIVNTLLAILGSYSKLQHWENSALILIIALMLSFTLWVIIFTDIVQQKIHNKSFWLWIMILMPFIAPLFYMIQRKRFIKLQ